MDSIISAFTAIFLPVLLGIIARTGNFIPARNRSVLQQFAVRIPIPALVFSSLINLDSKTAGQFIPMSLGLFLFMSMTWLLLWAAISILKKRFNWVSTYKSELLLMGFTGNLAYVCWKIHDLLAGTAALQRGIFYTSLYWPFLLLFSFLTVMVFGLRKTKALNKRELAYNLTPVISMVFIGLIVGSARIPVSPWLIQLTGSFGAMAIPLILFCMGLSISFKKWVKTAGPLFPFLLLRLGIWTVATLIMIKLPWYDDLSRQVLMINAMAPLGVAPIVISDMFGMDTEFIANSTIISTVLFLLFIPGMFLAWG